MIRNVVVGRVREGVPAEQVEAAIQALRDLVVEGVDFRLVGGQDRSLRDGNAHYALTADFVSDEAYRLYDADPEHNRIRRELFAPISTSIERIQFALPDDL
jgi:Stress responsive A/B Barrel Domain